MAQLCPVLKQRFFDANGEPLVDGFLYSYLAGTSTPAATYIDESEDTPNQNPVELDGNGEADVWLSESTSYKFILTDANDVEQFSIDHVSIANLDDEAQSAWLEHVVLDAQAATDLEGETFDCALYSSAIYDVEIIRGTTVVSNGHMAIQNVDGTARVVTGVFMALEAHGVTFSVSQVALVAQLKAALDSGAGNGTIKLTRRLISA